MTAMGNVVPYRSPHASRETTAYVGMIIFVAAWAMMFACLFFAYAALRVGDRAWPPVGIPVLPLGLPAINTALILVSSAALESGLFLTRRGRAHALLPAIAAGVVFGTAFLLVQWLLGVDVWHQGLHPNSGAYGSVFYAMAGIHAVHVAVGILAFLWLSIQTARGKYNTPQHLPVRLWTLYWHFVGLIWVLIFVFVFMA